MYKNSGLLGFCSAQLALFALAVFTAASAGADGVSKATNALYERLSSVQSLSADFEQKVHDHAGWLVAEQLGQLQLKRPAMLRWHCREPQEQLVVGDGAKIWLYDPDLEQVSIYKSAAMLEGPMTMLAQSKEQLAEQFAIAEEECELQACFLLVPRSTEKNAAFSSLRFDFDDSGLKRIEMQDRMRQRTETVLSDRAFNGAMDETLFNFVVPEGVDVVVND
ncbi:outer membrane lipoprotein chaperone LolA [Agaribacterium haliotis]|uniref:outer membrane lipoprotein chaperone LolA n=1 Tax=Agaribacterium haliotis TaxID=2013869 RepID=UPI00130423D0|nr:outer membrane lipoprotein chaperone LolA [Agaribacterium haliotis]